MFYNKNKILFLIFFFTFDRTLRVNWVSGGYSYQEVVSRCLMQAFNIIPCTESILSTLHKVDFSIKENI